MAEASVGPYRILERLGAGANGEVFLADDTRLHRRVALKTLHGTGGSDPSERRRKLLREARAAARLNHPHIAAVYDVLESDDAIHIVMEYVPGATLASRVRQGPLPPMQVLDYALQLSGALAHAHELGVVHRDLKPANVIASPAGQAKILDFGLARLHEVDAGSMHLSGSDLSTAEAHHVVGTPPYMPPEVLRGERFDARSDIYSLGVSLFELLTGRRPFEAGGGMALTAAILTAPTPRPRSVSPDVPAELDEVVFRAIARDPKDRYQSAADLHSDLKRLAAGITDAPTVARRLPLLFGHGQRRIGWTAVACLAVGVAVYGAIDPGRRVWRAPVDSAAPTSTAPRVVAVLPLAGAAGDSQTESLAAGVADALITTLSKVPGLTVVSRAATLKYQERTQDPDEIARELGATMLVDGALQRSGDRLRVTLSVLEPGSKTVRWQSAYDGTFADVLSLQREVADAVGDAMRLDPGLPPESPPTPDRNAFADYAQGRAFLERSDVPANIDRSIELFRSAIRRDARFARAHAGLGEALWVKFKSTHHHELSVQARDASAEALRLDPRDARARYTLALIYLQTGRREQAVEELRRSISLLAGYDEAHYLLGQTLAEQGLLEQGLVEITRAIRLRPNYWRHHHGMGVILYQSGRYGEAVDAFRRVTELQPDSSWGYQMVGTSYHAMGRWKEAQDYYQRAISLGDPRAYANLGTLYYDQQRYREALAAFIKAAELEPTSAVKHRNVGDTYMRLGDSRRARASYERAAQISQDNLRSNPKDALSMAQLAVYQAKLGHRLEALRLATAASELQPNSGEVLYREAVVRALTGELEASLRALEAALSRGYSAAFAAMDEDFESVRDRREYRALIARYGDLARRGGS